MNLPGHVWEVYPYQRRVIALLLGWSAGSIAAGSLLLRERSRFWRGFGGQFVLWGAIDAAIGSFGWWFARRRFESRAPSEFDDSARQSETRLFERVLLGNALLDVVYIIVASRFIGSGPLRGGSAWGAIWQAVFLLVFDLANGLNVRRLRRG